MEKRQTKGCLFQERIYQKITKDRSNILWLIMIGTALRANITIAIKTGYLFYISHQMSNPGLQYNTR